jgi:PAS domain S-box-containing protein
MDPSADEHELAALRASEERLRRALRVAHVGSWEWDIVADTLAWTDELFEIFAVAPADFEASYAAYIERVHPDDRQWVDGAVRASMASGEPFVFDHRVLRGDGTERILHARGEVIRDEHGCTVKMVGTGQDVTEARHNERRLRESEEHALLASRQKSQFLANMSHEIRTPLNGVIGMTELLADSALTTTQREHVNALHSAATSLVHLLNDILDVSKIEAGKVTLEMVDCDLPALISEMSALFKVAADAKGIELRSIVDESTPQWVRMDPARVKQILGNLVGNGLKFTERGTVSLAVARDENCLRFTVTDSGIGIAREDQDRLMSPFEQGDASTTRRFGGTGLGLAISRDLAVLMGGTITFTSEQNVGTTFVVELPFEPGVAPEPTTVPAPSPHVARTGGRVLLAEDTPVNQLVARAMLEKSGWTVELVENGQEALDALARDTFDVVILDCQMPILDGFSAARAIRELPMPTSAVPILAMTASALPEDRKRCLEAGMDEYLTKPISRAALDEALERVLATRSVMAHG